MQKYENDLLERITEIEKSNTRSGQMTKGDYIVAGIITLVCLIIVIGGAFIG